MEVIGSEYRQVDLWFHCQDLSFDSVGVDFLCVVFPPPLPQPLSAPAGAERGANSHIWATLLRQEVHGPIGVETAICFERLVAMLQPL